MFLRKSDLWKKIVYTVLGLMMSLFLILFTTAIYLFSKLDYYELGNDAFNKGHYQDAIEVYQQVNSDNENYQNALQKIQLAKTKIDSIAIAERKAIEIKKQDSIAEIEKQIAFQRQWADSLKKSYGKYLKSYTISENNDKITFYLNPEKNVFSNTDDINLSIFQENYNERSHSYDSVIIALKLDPEREKRQNLIYKQFSNWDGSHSNLKRYVKDNMNDPKSFEHIETTYSDEGSYIFVQMLFRGKNAFGAKVISNVSAKVDLNGNILSVSNF